MCANWTVAVRGVHGRARHVWTDEMDLLETPSCCFGACVGGNHESGCAGRSPFHNIYWARRRLPRLGHDRCGFPSSIVHVLVEFGWSKSLHSWDMMLELLLKPSKHPLPAAHLLARDGVQMVVHLWANLVRVFLEIVAVHHSVPKATRQVMILHQSHQFLHLSGPQRHLKEFPLEFRSRIGRYARHGAETSHVCQLRT